MELQEIKKKLAKADNLAEIGRALGLTRSYMSALANDKEGRLNPSYPTYKKLVDYFNKQ